jgi:Ca-activated chloride channel family protein
MIQFVGLILSGLFAVSALAAPSVESVLDNQQGVNELKNSNPSVAQEKFLSGLATNPLEAKLHYNLGLTFELLGQMEKAQASYQTALKLAQDDATHFSANFNLGEMAQKAKKKDEALAYYQEALKYDPDSKETKTNIELLTQNKQGKGEGDDQQQQKDPKDQDGKGKGDPSKDPKENKDDKKDDKDSQGKDQKEKKDEDKKQYAKNKPQPQKFKSGELTQGDVNKILGEIKQQEQKIRAEFNKKEAKEPARDKDW